MKKLAAVLTLGLAGMIASPATAGVDDVNSVADGCQVVGTLVAALTGNSAFQSAGSGCSDLANLTARVKCRNGDYDCSAGYRGGARTSGNYSSTRNYRSSGYRTAPGAILGPSSRGRAPTSYR